MHSGSAPLASALTPLAAALAATPIVALAPVFFKWFGQVEPTAKQAVVAVVVLFPVFVSTSKGLLQVSAGTPRADAHVCGGRLAGAS